MNLKSIFNISTEHGEGPIWDAENQQLYWVDILEGLYHKGDPITKKVETYSIGQPLGFLALRENEDGVVMGVRDGFGFFGDKTKQLHLIEPSPEQYNEKVRFNDGAVDPMGRVFGGTMEWNGEENIGKLFRLNADHSWKLMEKNIFITNGMGWNPEKDTYFMIDTLRHVMYAYDYNLESGDISNRRIHIQFAENEFPDGMTIDSDGGFWVAMWEGSMVIHFDRFGKKTKEIFVPVLHTTSCCFGGKDLTTLFITTSKMPLSQKERIANPLAGRTFYLETKTKGQREIKFKG